jgi:hypothetical protein
LKAEPRGLIQYESLLGLPEPVKGQIAAVDLKAALQRTVRIDLQAQSSIGRNHFQDASTHIESRAFKEVPDGRQVNRTVAIAGRQCGIVARF